MRKKSDKTMPQTSLQQKIAPATLVAVSKTQPCEKIRALYNTGICHFGENYLQEALPKMQALTDLPIIWHYIGAIQRNKTTDIACFDWVQSIDRAIIATRLNSAAATLDKKLQVLVQVNIDDEPQKAGVAVDEVGALFAHIAKLPNLALRGIMIIPQKNSQDAFVRAKALFDTYAPLYNLDTLSMGMSADYTQALMHGATMVRIGTALFGVRNV